VYYIGTRMCTALLVSINKKERKRSRGAEETTRKKNRGNLRTYMELYTRVRARALVPTRCSTKKGGFLRPFSFLYLQKHAENLPPIAYPLMSVSLVRQYKEENVYPYTIYTYHTHICIYITFTRALSAYM
jgi:hypothetical protein